MGKRKKKCKLCSIKNKVWEEQGFFGIMCNKHFVPMIVSVEHKKYLTIDERKIFKLLKEKYYPTMKAKEASDSDEHFHFHLRK